MSIRIEQVTRRPNNETSDLGHNRAGGIAPMGADDCLAMVRHSLRDGEPADMIPVVIGAAKATVVNQYGHDLFIHVQYAKRGWQATYAATFTESGITNFTCYMS